MAQALARVQRAHPAWRKADLIRHLGELLPDHVFCADDATAARLLPVLADRVLAGEAGEQVLTLEDAIRRMTSLPARTFHFSDRGVVRAGAAADLVAQGRCLCCVPSSCISALPGTTWRPLTEPASYYPWSVLWRAADDSGHVRAVVSCAQAMSKRLGWLTTAAAGQPAQ